MWFGVEDGARRYDGVKWTAFTEADGILGSPVVALLGARDGGVYAGTPLGISRFRDGKWRRVFPPEGDPSIDSGQALPWMVTDLLEARDGSLWAGTGWGALRLGREGATLYTTEDRGAALRTLMPGLRLSIVPDGAAPALPWPGGSGAVTVGGINTTYGSAPLVIQALTSGGPAEGAGLRTGDRILSVDGQSRVAAGQLGGPGPAGTSVRLTVRREGRPEPFEATLTRKQVEGFFRDFRVFDVYEDRDGAIWFALGDAIVHCDIRNPGDVDAWRLYTGADGLDISEDGGASRILQTRDGAIWAVSAHGYKGVNRFDPSTARQDTAATPPVAPRPASLLRAGPSTSSGQALRLADARSGQAWTNFRLSDMGGDNHNMSILETEDGTLWVGGGFGVLHACRNGVWTVYRTPEAPVPGNRVAGLLEASDGALWMIGQGQEAVRLDFGTWTTCEGLNFQCETPDGAQWFVSQDSSVVRRVGQGWTRYGVEDGLMDVPVALMATRKGEVWAAGSHDSTAATAWFDGKRWSLQTHPRLSWQIGRAIHEASDGSLYFGTGLSSVSVGQVARLLRFDGRTHSAGSGQAWTHYAPPEVPGSVYGIGQTADGVLWVGGLGTDSFGLRRFDGQGWTAVTEPKEFASIIDAVYTAPKGDLWVGTRPYGAFHYDGKKWTQYDVRDGLADNRVADILQTADGSVYVVTGAGVSRFDGRTWTRRALPPKLNMGEGASLKQSRDGALWINSAPKHRAGLLHTVRHASDAVPPETEITLFLDKVSQPGNTTLAWKGVDPWKATPDEEVQYSYRMDGGEWSPFSHEKSKVFLALNSGDHTFEVKARDRDFNVDPTPASVAFVVVPPVWRQPWFIAMVVVFISAVGAQTARVIRRDRRLQEANAALSAANREMFGVNRELTAANQQIQEATKRKSMFLASMSHELRTPMNAIIGFTNLVLRRSGDVLPERQRDNLTKVKLSADHLLSLINDILDLSKVEAGRVDIKVASFDVKALIESCCATVSPLVKPGVALNYEIVDGVGEAHTDEARLRQIVINLLSNALKFTEKGEVKVSVRPSPQQAAPATPLPHAGEEGGESRPHGSDRLGGRGEGLSPNEGSLEDKALEIAVSDTGVGIPADALGYIFDEFRQVDGSHQQQKGTGLGLSITRKLTELLGGTIRVESEVGKGSTFTVRIPLVYRER